jgi:hypothetical protein
MASDHGARRKRRRGSSVGIVAIVVGIPLLLGTALVSVLVQRHQAIEEAAAWAIAGPPCASLTPAAYQAGPQHPFESFTYEGVGFGREYGHVSCNAVVNNGGRGFGTFAECQFTSAGVLKITTKNGDFYYSTGSRPSTVAVHQDRPSCVMAGHFTGASVPAADTATGRSGG